MAISGAFRAGAASYAVTESTAGPGRSNWGYAAGPGHMGTEPAPAGMEVETGPTSAAPSEIEDPWTVTDPPSGGPPDYEPPGHDGIGTVPAMLYGDRADELNGAARSIDRGANVTRQVSMVSRDASQLIFSGLVPSLGVGGGDRGDRGVTGEALRALTGRNSLAPNNPGSPEVNFSGDYNRQGNELVRLVDRKIPSEHGFLNHTKRPLWDNTAQGAKNSQPVAGTEYSRPFSNFATMMVGVERPIQRRVPRPWDEGSVEDGAAQDYASDVYQYETWSL